jgi:hypothetical protein
MADRARNYDRDYDRSDRDPVGRDWMTNQPRYGQRGQEDDRWRGSNYNRGTEYGGGAYSNEFGSGLSRDYSERGFQGRDFDRDRESSNYESNRGYWGQGQDRPFDSGRTSNFGDYDRNRQFGRSEFGRGRSSGSSDFDRNRWDRENEDRPSWSSNWDRERDFGSSSYRGGRGFSSGQRDYSVGSDWGQGYEDRGRWTGRSYGSGSGSGSGSGWEGSQGSSRGRDFGGSYGSVFRNDYEGYGDFDRDRTSRNYGNNAWGYDRNRGENEPSWGESIKNFFGIGPKGYKRSDDRVKDDVSERLEDHPRVDASNIEIQVRDGEVTLTGTVPDRNSKRIAEDVTEQVRGVKDVHNQIRVQFQTGTGMFGTSTSMTGTTPGTTGTLGTTDTTTTTGTTSSKKDRAA